MNIVNELDKLIKDVDSNEIDSLKDLYLELIDLRGKSKAINYTRCCEELVCERCESTKETEVICVDCLEELR